MLRSLQRTFLFAESLSRVPTCTFSLGSTRNVDIAYNRNLDLGRQVFRVFAIDKLRQRDDMSVGQIRDVVTGLTYPNQLLQAPSNIERKSNNEINDLFAEIGRLKLSGDENYRDILNTVNNSSLSSISADDVNTLANSNHPKFLLQHICEKEGVHVSSCLEQDEQGIHHVTVNVGDDAQYTADSEFLDEAYHLACLRALQSGFPAQLNEIKLDQFEDIPLEQDSDICDDGIRKVVVTKRRGEKLGFTIRGGQQKLNKNDEYVQLTVISPILISDVEAGGVAERCGLKVGDMLLGVNNESLKDKLHEQAQNILKKLKKQEKVEFTVQQNQHALLVLKAEERILQRDYDKVKEEMETPGLREWHAAKSRVDPMEYFLQQYTAGDQQKRMWRTSKRRKQDQLWHQYRPRLMYRKR